MADSSPAGFSLGIPINSLASETAWVSMVASKCGLPGAGGGGEGRMMAHFGSFG